MKKHILLIAAIILFSLSKSYSQELPMRGIGTIDQILKVNNNNGAQLLMRPSVIYEYDLKIGIGIDKPKYKFHVDGSIGSNNDIKGNAIYGDIKTQSIQPSSYPNDISINATTGDSRFLLKSDGEYALGDVPIVYSSQISMFDVLNSDPDVFTMALINNFPYENYTSNGLLIKTNGLFEEIDIPLQVKNGQDNVVFQVNGNGNVAFSGNLFQDGVQFNPSKWIEQGDNIYYNNGNVGINTNQPTDKLHVNGNQILTGTLDVDGTSYLNGIILDNDADITNANQIIGYDDLWLSGNNSGGTDIYIGATGKVGIGTSSPDYKLDIEVSGNGYISRFFNPTSSGSGLLIKAGNGSNPVLDIKDHVGNQRMIVLGSGEVGIGIEQPTERLHVNGNQIITGDITVDGLSYLSGIILYNTGAISNVDHITGVSHLRLSADNNGGTDVFINTDGNVGIGTISPTEALTVNGTVKCKEVHVTENVPASDFVFEDNYSLMSITDLETFVTENHHLPEVPSAADFSTNGYNLNEMDDLLLRKVEELVLYTIAAEKERRKLHSRIDELEKENQLLKN